VCDRFDFRAVALVVSVSGHRVIPAVTSGWSLNCSLPDKPSPIHLDGAFFARDSA